MISDQQWAGHGLFHSDWILDSTFRNQQSEMGLPAAFTEQDDVDGPKMQIFAGDALLSLRFGPISH